MTRALDMASRLPLLYREGKLVEGILQQPAQQIEIAVEDALEVQRAHFFDEALELEETAKLAALLNFVPETWQNLGLFRAWVHAQRDAVLQDGAITIDAIRGFSSDFSSSFQQVTGARLTLGTPELVENPPRRKFTRPPIVTEDTVPLTRFSFDMRGLDETFASFLLVGLPAAPESVPVVANLTTGEALVFRGNVEPGQRLWMRAAEDGSMTAQLEAHDVTHRLISVDGLVPGTAWEQSQVHSPARAIRLVRGENTLWFLPVAHYDEKGLDRFLLALANLALEQGHWDESNFDEALFYQDPAVMLKVSWVETEPASFEVNMQAPLVLRRAPAAGPPEHTRDQLGSALDQGIKRLKGVGIRSAVHMVPFSEIQPATDFLAAVLPLRLKEAGSTGADRMPDKGGLFGVTEFGESTFR